MGFFFSIIYGLYYRYLLMLMVLCTGNTILFFHISSTVLRIRWLHLFTVSVVILMVDGIGDGPEFLRYGYRSLVAQYRIALMAILHHGYNFFFNLLVVPRVARVLCCPLRYCPACHNKATWNRGSSLAVVLHFWLLTRYHRCACSPSARYCTPWTGTVLFQSEFLGYLVFPKRG